MKTALTIVNSSRRDFLKTSATATAGLVLGFYLPPGFGASPAEAATPAFAPNAWIRIATDGQITLMIDRSEMGQGVVTSLSMLLAEELEADWEKIRTEFAPAAPEYFNPMFGMQGTGGSTSVRAAWEPLRKAGAAAREMLIAAAAGAWGAEKSTCRAERSVVTHTPSGRRMSYGELAEKAAALPVPTDVPLKAPKDFRILGRPTRRLDTPAKVNGRAEFGIDVRLPGMLHAVVARCPVFAGKVATYDAARAKAVPGVRHVVPLDSGIAVVADDTWSAMEGRRALNVNWDEGPNAATSSASIRQLFEQRAQQTGVVARKEGDPAAALQAAAKRIDAVYEVPFLAHATMEPMNCTAQVRSDSCDVWAPTQFQTATQGLAAKITGLSPGAVRVHTTFLGGGFGRRAELDFAADAIQLSKAIGAPVQVTYAREDDIQHDFYRPASYNRLSAGLDDQGWPVAWTHRIVSPSIMSRVFPQFVKNGLDDSSVEGAADLPYGIPNLLVDYVLTETPVPVGFWRSVGHSQNAYITESFVDELAAATRKDPFQFRRRLLSKAPRHLGVLELASTRAGWATPLPAGRARGIAVHESFGSFVAQVAEVSVTKDRQVRVHRVVCAVDCGMRVNPDTIVAQMESGVIFGLTAALKGAITFDKGRVQQSNFHDYELLRLDEVPVVEVYIVPSQEPPGGIGEPGTPPIAPAVVNALFAATGKRIRRLPIRAEDLA